MIVSRFMGRSHSGERGSPRAQHFTDGPGLRDAAPRMERRVSVEDFTQRTETGGRDLFRHRFEKTTCHFRVLVNAQMGQDKWADQPTPNGALVIDAVAMLRRSAVVPVIIGALHGQTPQTMRG